MSHNLQPPAQTMLDKNREDIIDYYDSCWLNRFFEGHNPASHAMHFGVFRNGITDNDSAKNETNRLLAELLGVPQEPCVIADMGCGVGGTCAFLAESFPRARVIGINISASQVEQAEALVRGKGLTDRVSFLESDYRSTPLAEASADHAFVLESLWHSERKASVFHEAARIVRKGGTFAVIDYFQSRPAANENEAEALMQFNNGWGAYVDGTGPIKVFEEDFESELVNAGFRSVQTDSLLPLVMPGIRRSFEKAQREIWKEGLSASLRSHYQACIALLGLVESGMIDYCSIVAHR